MAVKSAEAIDGASVVQGMGLKSASVGMSVMWVSHETETKSVAVTTVYA